MSETSLYCRLKWEIAGEQNQNSLNPLNLESTHKHVFGRRDYGVCDLEPGECPLQRPPTPRRESGGLPSEWSLPGKEFDCIFPHRYTLLADGSGCRLGPQRKTGGLRNCARAPSNVRTPLLHHDIIGHTR